MSTKNLDFSHGVQDHWHELPDEDFGPSCRKQPSTESPSVLKATTTCTSGGPFVSPERVCGGFHQRLPHTLCFSPLPPARPLYEDTRAQTWLVRHHWGWGDSFPTQLYLLGLLYKNQGLCAALRVHARSMPEAEVRSAANQVDSTGVPPSCASLRGIGVRGVGGFAVVREICLRS